MSKITIALLCALYITPSVAQIDFANYSRENVDAIVKEVLSLTKNKYSLVEVDSAKGSFVTYEYADFEHKLYLSFGKQKRGGNYDLGINDTIVYTFSDVTGFYQDVFPFWEKYFQPGADYVQVAKDGHGRNEITEIGGRKFIKRFNKRGKMWSLELAGM